MGTSTLETAYLNGQIIDASHINELTQALLGTFLGRDSAGAAVALNSLGTEVYPWGDIWGTLLKVDQILNAKLVNNLLLSSIVDSSSTGADVELPATTKTIIRLTNASLTSITMMATPLSGLVKILVNDTTVPVLIKHKAGSTAANQIDTGTGANITMAPGSSLLWVYEPASALWRIVGGSGSGGGISQWETATPYKTNDIVNINDKFYRALSDHTSGTFLTDLLAAKWKEQSKTPIELQSTGITSGAALTIGTPNTTITVASGSAVFVDNTGGNDLRTEITWITKSNQTLTFLASALVTFIGIDINGNLVQQTVPFTNAQTRTIAPIGAAVHSNLTIVNAVNNQQSFVNSPYNQFRDLSEALGIFNVGIGNKFFPNGANLNIDKTAGKVHKVGANYTTDPLDPNNKALGALTAATFRYRRQNGAETTDVTAIDPNNYDVSGVSTAIPNGKFTIQRINIFTSNLVRIQPGQAVYNNLSEAISGITSEIFVTETNIAENGLLRGYLVIKKGATDLTNTSDALFVEASKFGTGGGSSNILKFCPPLFPQWYYGYTNAPIADLTDGIHFDQFDNQSNQEMFAMLTVPDEYIPGSPVKLKGLQFINASTSGNVLFRAQATLIQSNTILGGGTYTNQRTSTNTQVAVSGIANTSVSVGEIDLSSATGVIGVAVMPGYKILVRFYRDNTNETSGAVNDARLVRDGIVTFS